MIKKALLYLIFIALLSVPVYINKSITKPDDKINSTAIEDALKQFGFYLEEVSGKSGVNFIHHSPVLDPVIDPILPQIASMGASVSVCDFDKDGWLDFYVTNSNYNVSSGNN